MGINSKAASKAVKQLAGSGTGQSLMDRVTQARYTLSGSGLGKIVAKSTTEEIGAPKKKHLESYEMSMFVRKYSKYINAKTTSYQSMAFDFCKVKRGKDDGVLRTMPVHKLLKALPCLADQITVLLQFEALEKDLNNAIINAAFLLLYKDLIRLYASYNEGMINLIEKYFKLGLSDCRIAMDLYHAFPDILTKVNDFLTLAEVPPKVIQAMEQHLARLESKQGGSDEDEEDTAADGSQQPKQTKAGKRKKRKKSLAPVPGKSATTVVKAPPPPTSELIDFGLDETATADASQSESTPDNKDEEGEVLEQEESKSTGPTPTVVINDDETVQVDDVDDVSLDLQSEIIAAATSRLTDALDKSSEAVKKSAQQQYQAPPTPTHDRMGRPIKHDDAGQRKHDTSGPPSRSRSPARPGRPPTPSKQPEKEEATPASDSELDRQPSISSAKSSSTTKRARSHLELTSNSAPKGTKENQASVCVSPFAGDVGLVDDDTGNVEHASATSESEEDEESSTDAAPTTKQGSSTGDDTASANAAGAATETQSSAALDDLLGLDLINFDFSGSSSTTTATHEAGNGAGGGGQNPADITSQQTPFNLDDLMGLDPLLAPVSSSTSQQPPTQQPADDTTSSTQQPPPAGDGFVLPQGLKPVVPSTVFVRPAVAASPMVKQQSGAKPINALDALDSTLDSLASSLGGGGWGSTSSSNKFRNQASNR